MLTVLYMAGGAIAFHQAFETNHFWLIQKLYRVETQCRKLIPEERYARCQKQACPILDEMRTWLDDALPQGPPTSATGKAQSYLHNEWDNLFPTNCRQQGLRMHGQGFALFGN